MSEVVETKVVEIQFDNGQFIENVSKTVEAVDNLKDSLQFDSKSFDSLTKAANNIDLSKVADNIQSLSDRFSTFGIVGMTAVQRVTNEVMTLGGKLLGLLAKPWHQIVTGGTNRAANIAKAKFQLEGIFGKEAEGVAKLAMAMDADATKIQELTGYTEDLVVAMDAANYAVADTAYGLDSAAKAASVLATSQVDVTHFSERFADSSGKMRTEMQVALRAISGVAAMANTEYDQVAGIFERIAGQGRVMGKDWQSFASLGISAAAVIKDYLNEIGETANATEQDIRDMASKGKISFETLAMAMDSAYGEHAKDANNTFSGAFSNMKFALSKIGADFIAPIRTQVTPLFNDLRLSINNVRKALNFKMEFPNIKEEISIVEAFTRIVTNLSTKLHDLFAVWMGGQDAVSKAVSGLSDITGADFNAMKVLFDQTKEGTKTVQELIDDLSSTSTESAESVDTILHQLGETLEKTDDEIREMCRNGEISFEDFSNAASAAFGNTVWDKRVSQTAKILLNLALTAKNLGNTVASVVGPILEGFFKVILDGGMQGVIGLTEAMADLTSKFALSYKAQRSLVNISYRFFTILKSLVVFSFRVIRAVVRILETFGPLVDVVFEFAEVLATILEMVVDVLLNSNALRSAIELLTAAFRIAGTVIANVLVILLSLIGPALSAIASIFHALANAITSFDFSFLTKIAEGFVSLFNGLLNNRLINGVLTVVGAFFYAIKSFFDGVADAYDRLHSMIAATISEIVNVFVMIGGLVVTLANKIKDVVLGIYNFLITNFVKILAVIQEILIFSAAYTLLHFSKTLNELVDSITGKNKAETILAVAKSVRMFAEAILIVTAAAWALAYLPEGKLTKIKWALGAIFVMLTIITAAYMGYRFHLLKLKKAINKEVALANLITQAENTLRMLTLPLKRLIEGLRRAVAIKAVAKLVLYFAAAVWIFVKAMQEINTMDDLSFWTGLLRLGLIVGALTAAMYLLEKGAKGAGLGMMGVSVAMLAFLAVLKGMVNIIDQYADMEYGVLKWIGITVRIATVMALMAGAMALIGHFNKASGFGMMGAAISMLAFMVVLKQMEAILEEYSKMDFASFIANLFKVSLVLIMFAGVISYISKAISGESAFRFSWRNGITSDKTKQNFFGMMLMLFGLAVLLRNMSKAMIEVQQAGTLAWLETMALIFVAFEGLIGLANSVKDAKAGPILAAAGAFAIIATSLIPLTLFDPKTVLAAAVSMGVVLYTLSLFIHTLSTFNSTGTAKPLQAILPVIVAIGAIGTALYFVSKNDWRSILSAAGGISRLLLSLSFITRTLGQGTLTYNKNATKQMYVLLGVIGVLAGIMALLAQVPVEDPIGLVAMSACISMLALVMAGATRLIEDVKIKDTKSVWTTVLAMTTALSILALALGTAGRIFEGNEGELIALAGGILLLTPAIFAMMFIMGVLGKSLKTPQEALQGGLGLLAIISMIGLITLALAGIAQIGDVSSTVTLLDSLGIAMLKLVPAIAAFALIAGLMGAVMTFSGGTMALGFIGGLLGLSAILLVIVGFVDLVAMVADVGNVVNTVFLLGALGDALTAMIPFVATIAVVATLLGVALPLMALGIIGFRALLSVISEFAGAIAVIAQIGDVASTVFLLTSLTAAMVGMEGFLIEFMKVLTIVGALGVFTSIGIRLFSSILEVMVLFVASLTKLSTSGNLSQAIVTMNALISALVVLSSVFLVVIQIGLNIVPVIVGLTAMATTLGLLLGVCINIGLFSSLQNVIAAGLTTLVLMVNTFRIISETIAQVSYDSIALFVATLDLISGIDIKVLFKIALIAVGLMAVANPIAVIGLMSESILNGVGALVKMMQGIYATLIEAQKFEGIKVDGIIEATDQLIRMAGLVTASGLFYSAAAMIKNFSEASDKMMQTVSQMMLYDGHYIAAGLAEGSTDATSKALIIAAAMEMGSIFSTSLRNFLGIHSPAKDTIDDAHNLAAGIGVGSVDSVAQEFLTAGAQGMGDIFGDTLTPLMGEIGDVAGDSLLSHLGVKLDDAQSLIDSFKTENSSNFFWSNVSVSKKPGKAVRHMSWQERSQTLANKRSSNFIQSFQSEKEYLEWQAKQEENIAEEGWEDNDWSHFVDDLLKSLGGKDGLLGTLEDIDMSDLNNGISGLGAVSGSSAKNVDKLTQKIDGLMEKYENLWDDAKERANKDLFKGVDDQGDEFLDQIKDIMDQYKNIYKNAVEKTNSEDLFAEVKEDDESFAPETLLNNLEDQVNQVNELNTIIGSLGGRIADNNLRAAISNMSVDDLPELRAMYRMDNTQLAKYEEMYRKKVQANQNKIQNELTGSLSQITGQYTNVAEYVASDASTNILMKNMQAQIDQLNEYNATIGSLMTRVQDLNLREALAHMGVESLDELKMLNSMTDAQLDQYIALYNDKIAREAMSIHNELSTELSTAVGQAVDISEFYEKYTAGMENLSTQIASDEATYNAGQSAGNRMGNGFSEGITSSEATTKATETGQTITTNIANGMSDEERMSLITEKTQAIIDTIFAALEESMSTFEKCGFEIVHMICRGLDMAKKQAPVYETASSVADTIRMAIESKYKVFFNTGMMISRGIAEGINSDQMQRVVEGAATSLALKAINSARKKLGVHSPSKEFMKIGRYVDEGFAIGLKQYSNLASDEAENMAMGSLTSVQDAISQLSGMLDGSIDVNPVITPTLDLSQVNARSSALANMFNSRQIAVQAHNDEQQAAMITQLGNILAEQNSEPKSITFNQTNNSPKALSNAEIYRHTRNGFSQLVSALS